MTMLVTTGLDVPGYRIVELKGIVRGLTVRVPTIAQGLMGALKSIVGGQVGSYITMCEQARKDAYDLMLEHAEELGANAIIGMRYNCSEISSRASAAAEILCYGTAVRIEAL